MPSYPRWRVCAFALVATVAFASAASRADTINASYSYQTQPLDSPQHVNYSADFGIINNTTTIAFLGTRQDLPAGPGVDTFVPPSFLAYCVEIGEPLNVPATNMHTSVLPLLGSTTQAGGASGPVFFDPTRTERMEKLWTNYSYLVQLAPSLSPAFQLAVWEVAFDDDMTLVQQLGSQFWVSPGQAQPGLTDVAELWLTDIRDGVATARSSLFLLTRNGTQDLITTPEPGCFALVALLAIGLLHRRGR